MSTLTIRRGVAGLVAAGALSVAALAAVPQAEAATLYACVKKNGTARIYSKKPKCKKKEAKLSWNTQGPAGKNGTNGANGANGATGKEGLQGKDGPAGPFPGTLPRGITLRGNFNIGGTASAVGNTVEGDISFLFQFASAPTFHYIKAGGASTPECPGTTANPSAAPGNLCVYSIVAVNTSGVNDNGPNQWGDTLFVQSAAAGGFFDIGTWAATSP